ncbi:MULTISPECIES: MBL fold metallo-hydrolase [Myxococcaceae]|uniref:MBL fold metallo-hydrolase n=1 Tax=Myxococcaceae TaxID=31 RepID=UPI00188FBA66|nr:MULTISPECIES: MBL fold metallo-hydrolase [Myxococcaceae]MBF5043393.1 MBL fold metallo-hydrolase [Simulacricoccus sp. 17bor-14]
MISTAGCGTAGDDSQAPVAQQATVGKAAQALGNQDICLSAAPIVGPARKIFQLNDHLIAFYDGRNTERLTPDANWVDDAANKLGVATYAIYKGNEAIVFDTFPTIDQARWQRATLESMGITKFTVVTSHWHNDHIAGNEVYADSKILMTARGLQFMTDNKADLEAGTSLFGPPAINPVVLPNDTYVGERTLHVGDITVELHQLNVHSPDETVILLPADRILLSGDTTEDSIPYLVEYADLKLHITGLKAMAKWTSFDRILPNHGNPDRIQTGGYDKSFIDATQTYITNMVNGATKAGFLDAPVEEFAGKALRSCDVSLYDGYLDVHEYNKQGVAAVWGMKHTRTAP